MLLELLYKMFENDWACFMRCTECSYLHRINSVGTMLCCLTLLAHTRTQTHENTRKHTSISDIYCIRFILVGVSIDVKTIAHWLIFSYFFSFSRPPSPPGCDHSISILHSQAGHVKTDSAVFRLHTNATVILLVTFSIAVTTRQYVGNPIDCVHTR